MTKRVIEWEKKKTRKVEGRNTRRKNENKRVEQRERGNV